MSPRYNSQGDYCTVNVSAKQSPSSHRPLGDHHTSPRRDRRHSHTYVRASTPHGDSDEDETIEVMGRTFVLTADPQHRRTFDEFFATYPRESYTNRSHLKQSPYFADPVYIRGSPFESPRARRPSANHSHTRRASSSTPRPTTSWSEATPSRPRPEPRKATQADAERHRIPAGYSLKHWDPTQEPYLLCGSVFDANSLGKWIFDWTVHCEGAGSPLAKVAGDLWLGLITFAKNFDQAEGIAGQIRSSVDREMMRDFVKGGERISEKLRGLLKLCEPRMLKAGKKNSSSLGKNSGVEFVDTLFGRDRELDRTQKFMESIRIFNIRFAANCEEILENPTR